MTARVEEIAWGLLGVLNHLQAKGSLVRIVVPRDMEVAHELHFDDPDTGAILVAQDFQDSSRIHRRMLLVTARFTVGEP